MFLRVTLARTTALFFLANAALYANDATYSPPQVLYNCYNHPVTHVGGCTFDNSFLTILSTPLFLKGDFNFQYAVARESDGLYSTDYVYQNPKTKGQIHITSDAFEFYTRPDFSAPHNQWKYDQDHDVYACDHGVTNPNATDCPFTHTPWTLSADSHTQAMPVSFIPHIKFSSKDLKAQHHMVMKHRNGIYQGNIAVTNSTPYPITLHVDDFNTATVTFSTNTVPPHAENLIVGTYQLIPGGDDQQARLRFDTQLGPDNRNTSNTTLYILDIDNGGMFESAENVMIAVRGDSHDYLAWLEGSTSTDGDDLHISIQPSTMSSNHTHNH